MAEQQMDALGAVDFRAASLTLRDCAKTFDAFASALERGDVPAAVAATRGEGAQRLTATDSD